MRRSAAVCGILLSSVTTLTGCALFGDARHDFDRVNAIGAALQPEQCGSVVYTGRFGSSSRAEGDPPSLMLVVVRDESTYPCIGERLEALGYTDGKYGWFKDAGGERATISAHQLAAGDRYSDREGTSQSVSEPGVSLLIRQG